MARKDVDTLLGFLGQPGRYQIIAFFMLTFINIPFAYNSLGMIFIGGRPSTASCRNDSIPSTPHNSSLGLPGCQTTLSFASDTQIAACGKHSGLYSNQSAKPTFCEDCTLDYNFEQSSETTIVSEVGLIPEY